MPKQPRADHAPTGEKKQISVVERVIRKRFGVLMLLALVAWPILGFWSVAQPIVANALLLDTYYQLGFLTMVNVVAFFFCFAILRLQNTRLGGRNWSRVAGDGQSPWRRSLIIRVIVLAVIAPVVLALCFGSEFPTRVFEHAMWSTISIAVGGGLAIGLLFVLGWIKSILFGCDVAAANYFPFEAQAREGLEVLKRPATWLEGFVTKFGLQSIDVQFIIYFTLLACVHYGTARLFEADAFWLTSAPSMLVVLIWLSLMLLAGLANSLDRWRVPVTLVLVLLIAGLQLFRGATRPLNSVVDKSLNGFVASIANIREEETAFVESGQSSGQRPAFIAERTSKLEDDAWRAISQRMVKLNRDDGKKKTLVVVTCPGGGIHAAAWAACVLDQLSSEYVEFKDSLAIVSGVSGGSVGSLLFVSNRYADKLSPTIADAATPTIEQTHGVLKQLSPALELAARSSLESIAYGLTVDDLYAMVGLPGSGRGQLLEDSFVDRLPPSQRSLTMGDWGDRALNGELPIVIFNSTDAVSGRRILFDTIPTPRRPSSVGLTARPINYRELMRSNNKGAFDVAPATAARTSATFPYVSPFTKPGMASPLGESVAIGDGGYVDNEGIVTAVNWIEFLLRRWYAEEGEKTFDRILLLRIEPASSVDRNVPLDPGGLLGWFRWLTGPAEAMVKVRSASQLERGNLEADLAALHLRANTQSSVIDASALAYSDTSPGKIAQQQNVVDISELDPTQSYPQLAREKWDKMLDDFSPKSLDDLKKYSPSTRAEAVDDSGDESEASQDLVVVQTVRFPAAGQTIPLNWKLSNRQKLGYLLAWKICAADGTPLREKLNQLYTRYPR